MTPWNLRFHHFGLAVRQPATALRFVAALGYTSGRSVGDDLQNVNLVLCTHATMPAVEVISPTDRPGPLHKMLSQRNELLYHLCYEAADIAEAARDIKANGFRVVCVSGQKPAVLFDDRPVAFYYVEGFGLIELLATR